MRIRKKLIFLHTVFSLVLAGMMLLIVSPLVDRVVHAAEHSLGRDLARQALAQRAAGLEIEENLGDANVRVIEIKSEAERREIEGDPRFDPTTRMLKRSRWLLPVSFGATSVDVLSEDGKLLGRAVVTQEQVRRRAIYVFVALVISVLGIYALIVMILEVFVLPRHVYGPIRAMLVADEATQRNDRQGELIPLREIPGDELGQIMTSRNRTVMAMRAGEARLNEALLEVERIASDLHEKNTLIEAAQRNLADADRLASLGVLSAGLAHEINTPLAVVKGLAEKLAASPTASLSTPEAQLLVRVVGRLERLSESLLDFARVRPGSLRIQPVGVEGLIEEAWTLVRLDREARRIGLVMEIEPGITAQGDADRLLQVLVNLLRNAVDAIAGNREEQVGTSGSIDDSKKLGQIRVVAKGVVREGANFTSIVLSDSGPGIPAEILGRLFEPFASTRLDANGTGLGLAVSLGIIKQHGGLLLARNLSRTEEGPAAAGVESRVCGGAQFEILLPMQRVVASASSESGLANNGA
jgi:signal transduction histidine kinase